MVKDAENLIISVKDLNKSFNGNAVLKNLNFELRKGENLVVMGKSGTGKSVLIKCLVSLIIPESGNISVFGSNISKLNRRKLGEIRKKMGFLFQSSALYDSMTVRENLFFPLERLDRKMDQETMLDKAMQVLEEVGLPETIDMMPSELSGGMRKRIGLARTIITNPEVLLYDEPTTGLDPVTGAGISQLINRIREKYQTSSIIITHDLHCAQTTADRIVMLRNGKVYAEGSYDELANSSDEWVREFFINQSTETK